MIRPLFQRVKDRYAAVRARFNQRALARQPENHPYAPPPTIEETLTPTPTRRPNRKSRRYPISHQERRKRERVRRLNTRGWA